MYPHPLQARPICTAGFHHVLEMEVTDFLLLFFCDSRHVRHLSDIPRKPSSQRFGSVCVYLGCLQADV